MKIEDLIKYHTDETISSIDKKHTKAEILQCLRSNSYSYASDKDSLKSLRELVNSNNSDVNAAKRMIMAYLDMPTKSEDNYPADLCKDADLLTLLANLFSHHKSK